MTAMRTTTRTRGQRFDIDCERFRAQLLHFMRSYGWNANTLGQAVIGHPSRVYRYLDGRTNPTMVEIIDPATKLSVNLNLTIAQTENISTNGLLALGLEELAEEAGSFEQAREFIGVASRSLRGAPAGWARTEIEAGPSVANG